MQPKIIKKTIIYFLCLCYILVASSCTDYEKIVNENRKRLDNNQNQEVITNLTTILAEKTDFADGYNLRGIALLNTNQPEKALADFNAAIKIDNTNYKFFYNRGNVYRQITQVQDALTDYEKAIELNPNIADLYTNKGAVLLVMNRQKEALAALNKSLSLQPSDKNALFNRGQIHFSNNDFERAIADLHHCVELAPDLGKAHYLLAMAEIAKNNDKSSPESCNHLQKALDLGFAEAKEKKEKYCQ
jgi:tetratricopeptide (TPR) repeat protein